MAIFEEACKAWKRHECFNLKVVVLIYWGTGGQKCCYLILCNNQETCSKGNDWIEGEQSKLKRKRKIKKVLKSETPRTKGKNISNIACNG